MAGPSSAQPEAVSTAVSEVVSAAGLSPSRPSDLTIARTVAAAVRSMPVVLDLSPGLTTRAATYGPGERVTGVVVRHASPADTIIEVHVVLRIALHARSPGDGSRAAGANEHATATVAQDSVLANAADTIRGTVYRAVQGLETAPPAEVDVLIDDVRTPD